MVQGLDARDSNISTSGLYQSLTYHGGLSGGSWLLSSIIGNNYPTISYLKENLWKEAFRDSLLDPEYLLASAAYTEITEDVLAKELAGFDTTLVDPYGRLLSYQLFDGESGSVSTTFSSVTANSNFTSHVGPFPIITAIGAKTWLGECVPGPNGTIYEITPYDFGSWDHDISAFTSTKYLGTTLQNGKPVGSCTTNYDNLGYVLGTSSNLFNNLCVSASIPVNSTIADLDKTIVGLLEQVHNLTTSDLYATYRNPFYDYTSSTSIPNSANNISAQPNLSLVDGGETLQNNPIFPFLQPSRNISALIVNDNSADTSLNYPNGSEILTTYVQSFNQNLTRMPFIPSVETFLSKGLNTRAVFFGCNDTEKVTIIWLPNHNFTTDSGTSTFQLAYSEDQTDAMIANGVAVASQGGNEGWGVCLGCAIMMKSGNILPTACEKCFEQYCYVE